MRSNYVYNESTGFVMELIQETNAWYVIKLVFIIM